MVKKRADEEIISNDDDFENEESINLEENSNFEDEAKLLIDSGGGIQLQKEEELYPTLKHFILSSEDRQKAGRAAAETVRNHRGAALRNIKIIEETRSA